jgi:hypothetical protein
MPPSGPHPVVTPQIASPVPLTLSPGVEPVAADRPSDPLAQAREALAKRRFDIWKIHRDADPGDRNLF